jgi:hypothetical protein
MDPRGNAVLAGDIAVDHGDVLLAVGTGHKADRAETSELGR